MGRLALEFRVHPVYLARRFRRHYGRSVGEVRRSSRVGMAVQRLTAGRIELSTLAYDLGYADQAHLSREFKRETGWTPARFRRKAVEAGAI